MGDFTGASPDLELIPDAVFHQRSRSPGILDVSGQELWWDLHTITTSSRCTGTIAVGVS